MFAPNRGGAYLCCSNQKITDMEAKYKEILNKFVSESQESTSRKFMEQPFVAGDRIMSTNAMSLVSVPIFPNTYPENSKVVSGLIPTEPNQDIVIKLSDIRAAICNLKTVDCYDEIETKCTACHGNGEVDFEFNHGNKTYESLQDCPVCEGDGIMITESKIPNGKKMPDPNSFLKIGISGFNHDRISELIFVAETLGADFVRLVYQEKPHTASLFSIYDVDVLLMPCLISSDSHVIEL